MLPPAATSRAKRTGASTVPPRRLLRNSFIDRLDEKRLKSEAGVFSHERTISGNSACTSRVICRTCTMSLSMRLRRPLASTSLKVRVMLPGSFTGRSIETMRVSL